MPIFTCQEVTLLYSENPSCDMVSAAYITSSNTNRESLADSRLGKTFLVFWLGTRRSGSFRTDNRQPRGLQRRILEHSHPPFLIVSLLSLLTTTGIPRLIYVCA